MVWGGRIEVRVVGLWNRWNRGATGARQGSTIPRGCGHNFAFVGLCTRAGHRGADARVGMLWFLGGNLRGHQPASVEKGLVGPRSYSLWAPCFLLVQKSLPAAWRRRLRKGDCLRSRSEERRVGKECRS